jgi:hypothetical protein
MLDFQNYFLEKNVLGLEEIIDLAGLGKLQAKLDSGNGAYNVLHGDNIKVNGKNVRFTTMNGQTVEKPIQDTITINVGAGNTEDRPVVLFNVKIGGQVFPNVPFSIGNRADNIHKVLIGKSFIQKELDALIDVGMRNIADKGIKVAI